MPLWDYKCDNGHVEEHLVWVGEECPRWLKCATCGENTRIQLPLVARTANRWGDTNGGYNKHLGQHVSNSMHREKILREKGLVDLRDMPNNYFEDRLEQETKEHLQNHHDVAEFKSHLAEGCDEGEALAKTFSTTKLKERGLLAEDIRGE